MVLVFAIVQAQEVTESKRSTTAKLLVTVKPVDANPPEVFVSSPEGFVDENSPIGTNVVDENGEAIVFTVHDKDFVSTHGSRYTLAL